MTVETLIEEKTAELFGDIHQLPEEVYVEAVRSKVLTSVNLGVAEDFLRQADLEQVRRFPQPPAYTRSIWHSLLKPSTYDPNSTLGKLVVGSGWIILVAQKPQLLGTDVPTAEPTLNGTNPL